MDLSLGRGWSYCLAADRVAAPMAANSDIGVIAAIPHPRWTTTRDTDKLLLPSSLVASTVTDTDIDPRSSAGTRCGGPEYGRDLGPPPGCSLSQSHGRMTPGRAARRRLPPRLTPGSGHPCRYGRVASPAWPCLPGRRRPRSGRSWRRPQGAGSAASELRTTRAILMRNTRRVTARRSSRAGF